MDPMLMIKACHYVKWAFLNNKTTDNFCSITKAIQNGKFQTVTDGSFKDEMGMAVGSYKTQNPNYNLQALHTVGTVHI